MTLAAFFKRLAALLITGLLSLGAVACGSVRTNTRSTSRNTTTEDISTRGIKEHIQEGAPFDSDKDTDVANPDDDDNGKPALPDADNDGDSSSPTAHYDSDDSVVLDFGHPASASDRRKITRLIRQYYAIAAAENGAKGCSMLYSILAEAVPEDYGISPPGPAYARGTTCEAVLSHVFNHEHKQIMARFPRLKVVQVRTMQRKGVALLNFHGLPSTEIRVLREGHTWKIQALLDQKLR